MGSRSDNSINIRANLMAKKISLLHFSMHSSQTVVVNFQFPVCSNLHEGTSVVLAPKLSIPSYTGYQGSNITSYSSQDRT